MFLFIYFRCHEAGKSGSLFGAKKSQEFIASLKTIMQEIEDFLSQTATNANSNAETLSQSGRHEEIISETESENFEVERNEEKLNQSRNEKMLSKLIIENQKSVEIPGDFSSDEHVMSESEYVDNSVSKELRDDAIKVDNTKYFVSDTEQSENESRIKYMTLNQNYLEEVTDDFLITDSRLGKQVLDDIRRVQSPDGSQTLTQSSMTNLSQVQQDETGEQKEFQVVKKKHLIKEEKAQKLEDVIKWTESANNEFGLVDYPISDSEDCYCDVPQVQGEQNMDAQYERVVKSKINVNINNQVENEKNTGTSQKSAESLALESLFAKLPPISSFQRTNSQDSSLSEDSGEGIDDSGVESDFFLRSKSRQSHNRRSLEEHSQELKSILGIGAKTVCSQAVSASSGHMSSEERLKSFKERLSSDSPKDSSLSMRGVSNSTVPSNFMGICKFCFFFVKFRFLLCPR